MKTMFTYLNSYHGNFFLLKRGLFIVFAMVSGSLFAVQTDEGQTGQVAASFLEVNPSVRHTALGGFQAAASGELSDFYANPATLMTLQNPELWMSHTQSFMDSKVNTLSFGAPFKNQTLALSAQYHNHGSHEKIGIDAGGAPVQGLGDFNFSTTLLHLAWARSMWKGSSLGIDVKGWHDDQDGYTSSGWAADAGFLVPAGISAVDLGVVARNIGPSQDGDALPKSVAAGLVCRLPINTALFSEIEFSDHRNTAVRAGIEYAKRDFWLRGGYQNLTNDLSDPLSQFSFGGGVRIKGWKIDYAWLPKGDLGDQHQLALGIPFGLTAEDKERMAQDVDKRMEKRIAKHAEAFYDRGLHSMKENKWDEAVIQFKKALTWNPHHKKVQENLRLAEGKLNFAEAQKFFSAGEELAQSDRWLDAAFQWQEAVKLAPEFKEAQAALQQAKEKIKYVDDPFSKGIHYFLAGNYDEALLKWNQVMEVNPQHPHLKEYMEKAEKMKLERRVRSLEKELQNKNEEVERLAQQAYTLYTLNQLDKAILTWKKILVLEPENSDAKAALQEAQEKRTLNTDRRIYKTSHRVAVLNSRAMSAYSAGKHQKAAGLWRQAITLDPRNRWIRNNLNRVKSEMAEQAMNTK